MSARIIRTAGPRDLAAIDDIYNHYVRTSTCTYQYEPTTPAERATWFREHDERHPVTVAVLDGVVVGWGALSWFRTREGYRFTVEDTIYVHHDHHRCGIGRELLLDLLERARALGHRTVVAGTSAEQEGSLALHLAVGFVEVARLRQVGFKFDQWLDVVFLQRMLA
jgi:phosphinothricin acetyltransferase